MQLRLMIGVVALGAITAGLTSFVSAQQSTEEAHHGQILSISTTPRLEPAPVMQDYLDAFKLTHDAGVDGDLFTAKWNELEGANGKYLFDDYLDGMGSYESVYPDALMFGIQV